jgi:hypothetical protein
MKSAGTHFEQVPKAILEKILAKQIDPPEMNYLSANAVSSDKRGPGMDSAAAKSTETVRSNRSAVSSTWEKRMDSSTDPVFSLIEQNASWWEQAALTCEQIAANHGLGTKEEWQLMGAVYRERAQMHTQILDQLRRNGISSHR